MRRLALVIVVVPALSLHLSAQERDRSLERISLALQPPPPLLRSALREVHGASMRQTLGVPLLAPLPGSPTLGPFTLGTSRLQGEIIRLSLPVGELVSRGARALAAANRRRQEADARRKVQADLEALAER